MTKSSPLLRRRRAMKGVSSERSCRDGKRATKPGRLIMALAVYWRWLINSEHLQNARHRRSSA